jgi:hypothetical protein
MYAMPDAITEIAAACTLVGSRRSLLSFLKLGGGCVSLTMFMYRGNGSEWAHLDIALGTYRCRCLLF